MMARDAATVESHLHAIEAKNVTVQRLKREWECLKKEASDAKKAYDEAVDGLTAMIEGGLNAPLFEGEDAGGAEAAALDAKDTT